MVSDCLLLSVCLGGLTLSSKQSVVVRFTLLPVVVVCGLRGSFILVLLVSGVCSRIGLMLLVLAGSLCFGVLLVSVTLVSVSYPS